MKQALRVSILSGCLGMILTAIWLKPVQIKTACLQPEKVVLSGVRRLVAVFRSRPEACYSGQVSSQNEKRRPVAALHTVRLIYAQASFGW
jgi:hypothetical protein